MRLDFEFDKRHYSLEFNTRVIQIMGESAVGKSLMYQDLQAYLNKNPEFEKDFLLINVHNKKLFAEIERLRGYEYVVVDNADIVITQAMDEEIINSQKASRNYWILIGREPRGSVTGNSVGVLTHTLENGHYYFKMDYTLR